MRTRESERKNDNSRKLYKKKKTRQMAECKSEKVNKKFGFLFQDINKKEYSKNASNSFRSCSDDDYGDWRWWQRRLGIIWLSVQNASKRNHIRAREIQIQKTSHRTRWTKDWDKRQKQRYYMNGNGKKF